MDILAAITIANETLKAVKTLKDVDRDLDKAELKSNMAELYSNLAEVKMALTDAKAEMQQKDSEIADLRQSMEFKATLVEVEGFKFRADENGNPFGNPFCPACEQNFGKFFQISYAGRVQECICPNCQFNYKTEVSNIMYTLSRQ